MNDSNSIAIYIWTILNHKIYVYVYIIIYIQFIFATAITYL